MPASDVEAILKRILVVPGLTILLAMMAACGMFQAPAPPSPLPTPTLIAMFTPTPEPPVALVDAELLGSPDMQAACDHPPEANMTCENEARARHTSWWTMTPPRGRAGPCAGRRRRR